VSILLNNGSPVDVHEDQPGFLPCEYALAQNFPNTFNPTTTIEYSLPTPTMVTVTIFNLLGAQVRTLVDEPMPAGTHSVRWDGCSSTGDPLGSGVYFYSITAGDQVLNNRMLLLK